MNCSATVAEVTTHGTYNDDPAPKGVNDCELPGIGPVRLKVGAGPIRAYGQGYGQATMFVSLWMRQAKIVSRESFKCDREGLCELRIAVSRGGLHVCRRTSRNPTAPESCIITQWSDIPTVRDTAEYPLPVQRVRPPDDSVATAFASDEKLCSAFTPAPASGLVEKPYDATEVKVESTRSWERVGSYDYYDLDVDNDGRPDHVVHLRARTHASDADKLFIFSKTPVPDVAIGILDETHSDLAYMKAADRVLPDAWPEPAGPMPTPWWDPENSLRSPLFQGSAYLDPIRFAGKTYFIATTPAADQMNWSTVLEPRADGSVKMVCAFQRVSPVF